MASDDTGDKTEEPTDKRRAEAREKGNVAKSTDLNAAILMLAACGALLFLGSDLMNSMAGVLASGLGGDKLLTLNSSDAVDIFWKFFQHLAASMMPFMLFMFVVALAVNLGQIGFLFTTTPLEPKFDRLNPISGFKRIFSIQSMVKLGVSVGKIIVLVGISAYFISTVLPIIDALNMAETSEIIRFISWKVLQLAFFLALSLISLAVLDFMFQRWKHEQDLKMSKQEIRDEMKNMEGDPQIRARRREAHRKLAEARDIAATADADVVLTNPTHYSVALKYDPQIHSAPVVVAKGIDEIALRIREVARENNVPIIERREVARALYRDVKVGQPIPADMYEVFVEIMAYVYKLTGKTPVGLT